MNKKILVVSIAFLTICISIIVMNYNTNTPKTFTQDGITYALTLDGASINAFPSKGMYQVDVNCEDATGKWLYNEWKLSIENFAEANITCDVSFNTIEKTSLNNYIIGLSGTTQGDGQVVNENGYRYEGKNPNNYIWFNNELWRIIGVFDSTSHGQAGQNLVKLIKSESIGGLSWDKSSNRNWSSASLNQLLNGVYLNSENGTGGEYCYGFRDIPAGNCDYTKTGISDAYRQMIKNVTWQVGGVDNANISRSSVPTAYSYEVGANSSGTTYEAKIGLMYASDYGYSVLASSCARNTKLSSYDSSNCAGQSWLYGRGSEWTITTISNSSSNNAFRINTQGYIYSNYYQSNKFYSYAVRPVLYLDSNVYVIDGNGSQSDPYIIGM